jgi:hypothetical protein
MFVTARHIIQVDNIMLSSCIQGHVSDVTNVNVCVIYRRDTCILFYTIESEYNNTIDTSPLFHVIIYM